jgi:hypothetical protein
MKLYVARLSTCSATQSMAPLIVRPIHQTGSSMLRRLDLLNFKAFDRFRVDFRADDDAFLVGPNNAGKSTILAALRAGAYMARLASRRQPTDVLPVDGASRFGWGFSGDSVRLVEENLRHEFRQDETRLTLHFSSGASLHAIWPKPDDDQDAPAGFFYVRHEDVPVRLPSRVREVLPSIGVVPVLSPLEHTERLLSDDYVRNYRESPLASRHVRNQIRLLQQQDADDDHFRTRLDEFRSFAEPWLPEITLGHVRTQYGEGETSLDLFYEEAGSRVPKEIFWLGDGMQIWLQLLLHLFRLGDQEVIVLDEPEVFLHADLQRRMVELLEAFPGQTVTATHSAEVIAEAHDESVIWVSKSRARSVRSPKPEVLYELSAALGTAFNLRLARALRAQSVLFVEGRDGKLLRDIARTAGVDRIANERDLVIVPMPGFDRWTQLEFFQWIVSDLLEDSVSGFVILDRDYRPQQAVDAVESKLRATGLRAHVWRCKEFENYLLCPAAIARLSGATSDWIAAQLQECADSLEDDVWAQLYAEQQRALAGQGKATATVAKQAKKAADQLWSDPSRRVDICGGKELLRLLNGRLQHTGHKAVTDRQLARHLRATEIPKEMRTTLRAAAER